MSSYNKNLIKQDLLNIKNWTKNTNWKGIKKQLYIMINTDHDSGYTLYGSGSKYDIYQSISRLSQLLEAGELFQLIKDFNKYYYKKDNTQFELLGGDLNPALLKGGFNWSSVAG